MQSQDTARSLSRRCHHGNVEALHTLLLGSADGLYSAALGASPDEAQAEELAVQTWETYLGSLGRRRPAPNAELALQRALGVEIAGEVGAAAADRAVRMWAEVDTRALVPAPASLIERLEELSRAMAPTIARRARQRRWLVWTGRAFLAACLVGLLLLGAEAVDQLLAGRARQVQYAALRQRVQAERLTWVVREALLDLGDPQGADRYEAALLAQVALLLEDIVADPSLSRESLRPLQQRIAQNDLLWRLREATQEAEPGQHSKLAQVTLLLEEAQNL